MKLSRKENIYVIIYFFAHLCIFSSSLYYFLFFQELYCQLLKIPMVYNKKRERVLTENETCQAQKSSNDDTDHNNEDHHQVRQSCNTKKIYYKVSISSVYHQKNRSILYQYIALLIFYQIQYPSVHTRCPNKFWTGIKQKSQNVTKDEKNLERLFTLQQSSAKLPSF